MARSQLDVLARKRQHHAAQRHRRRAARPRRGDEASALSRLFARMRAFPSGAGCCRAGPARRAMTRWPGAMPGRPIPSASTSSRIARSRASSSRTGAAPAIETTRGRILAERTAIAVAGHSSHVAAMAGLRLPVESHILQAFVSEPIKPLVHHVRLLRGRALLSLAIGQGRAGLRRPYRRLQHLYPARPVPEGADRGRMRRRRSCPASRGCGCCAIGAASWT